MKIENFDTEDRVFVVAEIGNNHEGDFSRAQEMIGLAADAGADAVKFQTFIPDLFVAKEDRDRMEMMRRFQLDFSQFEELAKQARSAGVVFFSTPLDLESAHFLRNIQPVFKIASGDNNFFPLIEAVAQFGKPTIISTGLADIDLLDKVCRRWNEHAPVGSLAYLHCVSCYPVPDDQANLGAIRALLNHFPEVTVGYSDHTLSIEASIYAVAAGARIIEKHFTLDKTHSNFRDHQLSADYDDMAKMVRQIRRLERMLGNGQKVQQACELGSKAAMRRSPYSVRDFPSGHELKATDVHWVRSGSALTHESETVVIGRRIRRSLVRGTLISPEDLD